jgi:hypothetical protein
VGGGGNRETHVSQVCRVDGRDAESVDQDDERRRIGDCWTETQVGRPRVRSIETAQPPLGRPAGPGEHTAGFGLFRRIESAPETTLFGYICTKAQIHARRERRQHGKNQDAGQSTRDYPGRKDQLNSSKEGDTLFIDGNSAQVRSG